MRRLKDFPRIIPRPVLFLCGIESRQQMAIRKTTFEVVPLADIAPLLGNADVLGKTPEAEDKTARKPARILSVSYDHSLAATREMLFASVGFQVSSVLNMDQAIKLCATERFDLIVIGHSLP